MRRLLHRWLVEYNPLYLLSAGLVLVGMWLCGSGLSREQGVAGPLGVAAIAEVYAACLIGGAALLTRIGQRRPAVMLALLTILYQWDLTLHTERSPYVASWAAAAWLLIFAVKIPALAWAVKLRLSRSAMATLLLGGGGLALFPAALPHLGPRLAGAALAAWVFALVSVQRTAKIRSAVPLDAWGKTVLRRSAAATWSLSAALVAGHVLFWSAQGALPLAPLVFVAPLLLVRGLRRESRVWMVVLGTLAAAYLLLPAAFSVTALLGAAALALRAFSPTPTSELRATEGATRQDPPYRAAAAEEPPVEPQPRFGWEVVPVVVSPAALGRLLTGAGFLLYVSAWSAAWTGGPWPAHLLALDLALVLAALAAAWRARVGVALAPAAVTGLHFVVQAGLLPAPRTTVEWGASAVALGMVLLLGSLAASYRLRSTS